MPVQLDIVGNLAKGAALREGVQRAGEERQARRLGLEGSRRALIAERGAPLSPEISKLYDPYEFKLGQMFKGVFGGEERRAARGQAAVADRGMGGAGALPMADVPGMEGYGAGQSALPMEDVPGMADGGSVADELARERRARGQPTQSGSAMFGEDLARSASENFMPRTRAAMTDAAEANATEPGEAYDKYGGGARGAGAAARTWLGNTAGGALDMFGGMARDALGPVGDFAAGALGFTGETQEQTPEAAGAGKDADKAAAVKAQAPAEEPVPSESPSTGAGAATPRSALSQQFVGTPEPEAAAAQLGNIDIMPEEMPSMGTRDWVAYRQEMVEALMMQGKSAEEAHKSVSAMQHEGFMRYAQQGAMMLQSNNPQGAARALKAAYQYFPNGADVKFGFQNNHLIAIAIDEETGKPRGKPQVITPEYLAGMVTNFQDPAKYLAHTKDWRDEAFRERTYREVTRQDAQSQVDYRQRSLDIAQQNADSSATSAQAQLARAQASGEGGGREQADYDRAADDFVTSSEDLSLDDPALARDLNAIMSAVYRRMPDWDSPRVVDFVRDAQANGKIEDLKAKLGLL